MTSRSISLFSKIFLGFLFVTCLVLTQPNMLLRAQEATDEELKALQAVEAEKDPAQKTAMIVKLLKANPKTGVLPNLTSEFQKVMGEFAKQKNYQQMINLGQEFLSVGPADSYVVTLLAQAYQATKNYKDFVVFGEKAFAGSPSGPMALTLAQAYQEMGNPAKYNQWGEKAYGYYPDNLDLMVGLSRSFVLSQNGPQSSKYAKLALKALPTTKKPDAVDEAAWTKFTTTSYATCYAIVGNVAYENKDFSGAIVNLENAVKYDKRNGQTYYALGMSYWQTNKTDTAMMNFAKAYVLKGNTAAAAKRYLDQLYKSSHRNSLIGQERIIQQAEAALK
jgi:tetratricopeptide (TPR) repeat protein